MQLPHAILRFVRVPARSWLGRAWLVAFLGTIRGRILIAFLVMSMITGALGGFAVVGMKRAGVLVEKTYDESLMSINYARAAATDFAAMRAAFARRWLTTEPQMRAKLDDAVDALRKTLADDLAIAAERSQSQRASTAAAKVQRAVEEWDAIRRRLISGTEPDVNWDTLDHYSATVDQQIDLLVNYTAGDGFLYRHRAGAAVFGRGGLAIGAPHHRAGGGGLRRCRAHRQRHAGR